MNYKQLANDIEEVMKGEMDDSFEALFHKVHCMSTPRVYGIINACVSAMDVGEVYLEVGTYQGGSLIAALHGNTARAIGVDSFGEFSETNNLGLTLENLATFNVRDRVIFHEMGFEQFFAGCSPDLKVQVYNYDGQHDYEGQLAGLEAGWKYLQSGSLVIVDDYRYPEVASAVHDFVHNHPGQIKFQFVVLPETELDAKWWNGVVVLRVV